MKMAALPMERLYPLLAEQLERGGSALLPVTGSSMLPALRQGRDTVVLCPPEELRRGDVILFLRGNGRYVLHRIIRRSGPGFLCCGDNQWQTERVAAEQVLARVSAVRRRGREIPAASPGWRLWAWLWTALMPVRRPVLRVRRGLGKLRRIWKNHRRR